MWYQFRIEFVTDRFVTHILWLSIVRQLVPNWYFVVAGHNLVVHNLAVQHKVETEFHWLRTRTTMTRGLGYEGVLYTGIDFYLKALVYLLLRLILSWSGLKTSIVNNNICCWLHDWLDWSCHNCCLRMFFFIFVSFEGIFVSRLVLEKLKYSDFTWYNINDFVCRNSPFLCNNNTNCSM